MADIEKMIAELKQKRDELALQIHLGSKEAQDEWEALARGAMRLAVVSMTPPERPCAYGQLLDPTASRLSLYSIAY